MVTMYNFKYYDETTQAPWMIELYSFSWHQPFTSIRNILSGWTGTRLSRQTLSWCNQQRIEASASPQSHHSPCYPTNEWCPKTSQQPPHSGELAMCEAPVHVRTSSVSVKNWCQEFSPITCDGHMKSIHFSGITWCDVRPCLWRWETWQKGASISVI